MVATAIGILVDTATALLAGLVSIVGTAFNDLIYNREAGVDGILYTADDVIGGLTDFASWMLMFLMVSLILGLFVRLFTRF